jgi:TolB-like protein/Tfp pilus assembly protein PilF
MLRRRYYEFGPYRLDGASRVLFRGGQLVKLAPKVADVLLQLVEHAGSVVEKEFLLQKAWPGVVVGEGSLTRTISLLRDALNGDGAGQRYVSTVPKRGYRFITPVRIISGAAAEGEASPRVMLAVLPFKNLSGDATQEYFSDGLTEEMVVQLGRINPAQLGVIARTTCMKYKNASKTAAEIGAELEVEYVLEGSVRRAANRVRITAQLIQASDQRQLWARTYQRQANDILRLQRDFARAIAEHMQISFASAGQHHDPRPAAVHTQAYQLCLKGRYFWYRRTEAGIRKAIDYFEQAISQDPRYAPAHAGLADCYAMLSCRGLVSPRQGFPRAQLAARTAVDLDAMLGEARGSLAHVRLHRWEWKNLESEMRAALELNPSYVMPYHWYSEYLSITGQNSEALTVAQQALEIDPLSLVTHCSVATAHFFARDYDSAREWLDRAEDLDRNYFMIYLRRGQIQLAHHHIDSAIRDLQNAVALGDRTAETLTSLAQAYATAERWDAFKETLAEIELLGRKRYVSAYFMAKTYAPFDRERSLSYLESACRERSADVIELAVEPAFDPIRNDSRFAAVVRRVGMPVAASGLRGV